MQFISVFILVLPIMAAHPIFIDGEAIMELDKSNADSHPRSLLGDISKVINPTEIANFINNIKGIFGGSNTYLKDSGLSYNIYNNMLLYSILNTKSNLDQTQALEKQQNLELKDMEAEGAFFHTATILNATTMAVVVIGFAVMAYAFIGKKQNKNRAKMIKKIEADLEFRRMLPKEQQQQ